jgi:hypothetical protein
MSLFLLICLFFNFSANWLAVDTLFLCSLNEETSTVSISSSPEVNLTLISDFLLPKKLLGYSLNNIRVNFLNRITEAGFSGRAKRVVSVACRLSSCA